MSNERFEQLATDLNQTAIDLMRRVREADRELGISGPRLSALSVLVFRGTQTLAALAAAEQVAAPTMSRLVDALEEEGLAIREPNPEDRRSILVSATAKGRRLFDRGQRERVKRLVSDLEELPEHDIAVIERAMEALSALRNNRS